MSDLAAVMRAVESIEGQLVKFAEKSDAEIKSVGTASADTKAALDSLGIKQREIADRLLAIEQKGTSKDDQPPAATGWGDQLVKADAYASFAGGHAQKMRVEVKNTLVGADANVAPDRKPGIVGGAFLPMTIETLLNSAPTSSNAIEYTRENVFTNSAAEAAEGAAKAESALTWTLVSQPVSTVAHWIKISRQLAADNAALAAYVNNRMTYGVALKSETQIVVGNGVAPNISGIFNAGNFTAHGIANAALPAVLKKAALIRKIMADSWAAGFPSDAILLNPVDWATIEIELMTTAAGQMLYSITDGGQPRLFGIPVVQSVGVTAGNVAVGSFSQAYTVYNREGIVVEMSDSDSDNFTKNLITIRAERRLALATERPAAVRAGTLTPA